jgi:hypothetical protein
MEHQKLWIRWRRIRSLGDVWPFVWEVIWYAQVQTRHRPYIGPDILGLQQEKQDV